MLENCVERAVRMYVEADGYEREANKSVTFERGREFVWELRETEPATGVVVGVGGEAVVGAELRLVRGKGRNQSQGYGGFRYGPVVAVSDEQGRFSEFN